MTVEGNVHSTTTGGNRAAEVHRLVIVFFSPLPKHMTSSTEPFREVSGLVLACHR